MFEDDDGEVVPAVGKGGNRYYRGPESDHFDGTLFFNPGGCGPRGMRDLARWQFGGGKTPWPKRFESPFGPTRPRRRVAGSEICVTMVGHATLLIQTAGLNILTDPVWSERASPFALGGPRRVNAPGVRMADLPPIDVVLVTHNHYDHMDLGTLRCLRAAHDPMIVTPLGNDALLHAADPRLHVTTLDWDASHAVGNGVRVHATPSHHWSARGVGDRCMALWASFVIETPDGHIYHVGDTAFAGGAHYRAAAERFGGFRLAILPIGAYEPRWFMRDNHQNPEEAVEGMMLCKAEQAVGHHWGTFRLTNEGITEPAEALARALAAHDIEPGRFRALQPGETVEVAAIPETRATAGNRA
ncbi:MAG: MBL fold metallo-hydrolase [Pararhizobium sp.]